MWDNSKDFIQKEIKLLHPFSEEYQTYWKDQTKKIIEGMWINGVYCPPQLYHYYNFGTLQVGEKKDRYRTRPFNLDYVWDFYYYWIEARGLSGFEKIGDVEDIRSFLRTRQVESDLGRPLYNNQSKNMLCVAGRGFGKDLQEDVLVYTKNSIKKIKDIQIGEEIFGYDGKLTKVINKVNYSDQLQYKVTLKDGRFIECGGGHLWNIIDNKGKEKVLSLNDIYKDYKLTRSDKQPSYRYFIPYSKPINYEENILIIEPYYLGLWLGDGNSHNTGITTLDGEILQYLVELKKSYNLEISINYNKNKSCPTFILTKTRETKKNDLFEKLKELNLIKNKHIPEEYFYSSIYQRMELLRGLMDTDGTIGKLGNIEFSNTNYQLIKDVVRLLNSLGIRNSISKRMGSYTKNGVKKLTKENYRVKILSSEKIFNIQRKLDRLNNNLKSYSKGNREKVAIVNIEPLEVKPSVCIEVDNDKKLFLAGDYIVTHNSYMGADIAAHEYTTDGKRVYNPEDKKKHVAEILLSAYASPYVNDLISKIQDTLNGYPGGIEVNGIYHPAPFFKTISGTWNVGKKAEHYYKKKVGGKWQWKGSRSCFKPRVYKDNALVGVGGRNTLKIGEEVGTWDNLIESHFADENTQKINNYKFGSSLYIGTGGDSTNIAIQKMMYDPEAYDCISIEDKWENRGKIAIFFPCTYTKLNYKDENGITIEKLAGETEDNEREKKKKAKSNEAYSEYVVYNPLVPSEIFLSKNSNKFPLKDIQYTLAKLELNRNREDEQYVGDLIINDFGKVEFKLNNKNFPIYDFPLKSTANTEGSIIIYEMPFQEEGEEILWGRYIGGIDPYDHDDSLTGSLGSTIILDRFTSRIVAEYSARPETAKDYYENVRRLLLFFNAKALYENQVKGIFDYFESKQSVYLLATQPNFIKDVIPNSKVERGYGVHMPTEIKRFGEGLINQWLRDINNGEQKNVHRIRCIPLLKELILYNEDGNFDRCLKKGTLISTHEDYIPVENIKVGDIVLTREGDYREVTWTDSSIPKVPLIDLKIIGSNEILTVTENHPILIAYTDKKKHKFRKDSINKIEFKEAKDLNYKYQFALFPKRTELLDHNFTDDFLYLMGWYCSDGYINEETNSLSICLQHNQEEIANKLSKIIDDYTRGETTIGSNNRTYYLKDTQKYKKDSYIKIKRTSKSLCKLLLENCGGPNNKKLSSKFYHSTNLLPFVLGFLEGDGHQKVNKNYDGYLRNSIECSGIYHNLIKQIRQILIDNGIWSSIRLQKHKGGKDQLNIQITGKGINTIAKHSLKFKIIDNLKDNSKVLETHEGFWSPIKKIKSYNDSNPVYNFEVDNSHTYIANGIVTHNCMALMCTIMQLNEMRVHPKDEQQRIVPMIQRDFFKRGIRRRQLHQL